MVHLYNEWLSVQIAPKGAELMSLKDRTQNYEWLWQGDPQHWGKRAPVLFPFIGCVKEGTYSSNGLTYPMSKHGFARDMVFEIEDQQEDAAVFLLRSNAQTHAMYPYAFEFRLHYRLVGKRLDIVHEVRHLGQGEMYFALGAHPAFNCPMDTEDWCIHFEAEEALESRCIDLATGLMLDESKLMGAQLRQLPLTRALFDEDALVFEQLKSKKVSLKGPKSWQVLEFAFPDFPVMAFWTPSKTAAPFICLEPWFGMADSIDHNGRIEEKYGMVKLLDRQVFQAVVTICLTGE